MSILLDSLQQNKQENEPELPNIHASHFDDEMLSDEWLLKKIKIWKGISFTLALIVIASWSYFLLSKKADDLAQAQTQAQIVAENLQAKQPKENNNQQPAQKQQKTQESVLFNEGKTVEPEEVINIKNNTEQTEYQSKKRENIVAKNKVEKNENTVKQVAVRDPKAAILVTELPANLQNDFPSIELGSYVVADAPQDSFVILDGSFYKINQVIAPSLILRGITKDHIVVEFKNYWVKLPHN